MANEDYNRGHAILTGRVSRPVARVAVGGPDDVSALLGRTLPEGHALLVRLWTQPLLAPSPNGFAASYAGLGFRWIGLNLPSDPAVSAALRARGINVVAFWEKPRVVSEGDHHSWRERIQGFLTRARAQHATAIIINPEVEFRDQHAEARAFMAQMVASGLPIIVATYGTPQGFPDFPWAEFANGAAAGMPLLFDRDEQYNPAYFVRGMNGWRERGFSTLIVDGSTWSHADDSLKTPDELERHLAQLPRTQANALWAPARLSAQHQEVLRAWNRGAPSRRGAAGGIATALAIGVVGGLITWAITEGR